MNMSDKWNRRFLEMCELISTWSKDQSTKVGAVIVEEVERRPISFGYNGIPRGCLDSTDRMEKPVKYLYAEHAERNAIYNARTSLAGCTIFVTHPPCADCARGIIQSGIKKVVVYERELSQAWNESIKVASVMFNEAGVEFLSVTK